MRERGSMIKKTLLITVCFLMLGSIVSAASDWLYFIDNEEGEKCYIDLDSIKHIAPDTIIVTSKVEHRNSSDISSLVSHLEMDCSGYRLKVLKEITHYKNGKTGTATGDSAYRKISAADFEESLMELVCSLKKRAYRD